jgi:ribosomal protein S18 acetylase RimI-like enzyme
MYLKVRKGNLEAVSMYEKAGYLVLESIKESGDDILLMTKDFGADAAGMRQRTDTTHAME